MVFYTNKPRVWKTNGEVMDYKSVLRENFGLRMGPDECPDQRDLLVLDKNYKYLDYGWDGINGGQQPVGDPFKYPHDLMAQEYTAREEGWIYVYVSNENSTLVEVYFDDVTITHTKSNLIQYNEYYPFGHQTANSWTRPGTMANNFLANGGTELNTTSNLYDLDYRNYDPVLGRMNQVDPIATKYHSISAYSFSFNNPITWTDRNGADPLTELEKIIKRMWEDTPNDPGGGGVGTWSPSDGYHYYESGSDGQYYEVSGAGSSYSGPPGEPGSANQMVGIAFSIIANTIENAKAWGSTKHNFESFSQAIAERIGVVLMREVLVDDLRKNPGLVNDRIGEIWGFGQTGSARSLLEATWNSDFMRNLVPDVLTIDISIAAAVAYGRGGTWSGNFITRGDDWGWHPTNLHSDVYGGEIGYGLNFGYLNFFGPVAKLNSKTLEGPTIVVSGGFGVGANATFAYPSWEIPLSSPSMFGLSIGIGDTVGLSVAVGETRPGLFPLTPSPRSK